MLTLHFIPNSEMRGLSSPARIDKLLSHVKEDKIVIFDGKLSKSEEVDLIRTTMEAVSDKFKGIELQVWESDRKDRGFIDSVRIRLATMLVPEFHDGFTIIGPANIIKEMKKDPSKIQLITQAKRGRR